MLADFLEYIKEHNLIRRGDRVLLAVSGGIDSMVMTHLFISAGIETGAAHCNFCLRGDESDSDEDLVKRFMLEHKIPCFVQRFDTKTFASEKKISVQMAARELRYSWFEKIMKENSYKSVAVAHNLNDNIETIIFNLTRGTGLAGLTGMKPSSGYIIRPLLFATRDRIVDYCTRNKVPYREDRSNAETKYSRNKIRHLVIPVLKEINPSVETTLNETGRRLKGVNDVLNSYVNDLRNEISYSQSEDIIYDAGRLVKLGARKAVLFELFRPYSITASTLDNLSEILEGRTGGEVITTTHRLLKNRKQLIVSPVAKTADILYVADSIEQLRELPFIRSAYYLDVDKDFPITGIKTVACLDADKVTFPLKIRKWLPGDTFFPLGMNRSKKLSDFFIDCKFSLRDKEKALMLESAEKIVWVIGERIDDRFKITDSTKVALRIELKKQYGVQ